MGRSPRTYVDGLTYHVTARGNDRQRIFDSDLDHHSFLAIVEETRAHRRWRVHAWCLMVNHFHLLVSTEEFDISTGLRDILGRYARRYNHFHERTGHLFGRRFHAVPVTSDEQFFATVRYVNRNPVRAGMVHDPGHYPWSGYARRTTLHPPIAVDETTVLGRLHPVPAIAERQLHDLIRSDVSPGRAGAAEPAIGTLIQVLGAGNGARAAVCLGYRHQDVADALGLTANCLTKRLRRPGGDDRERRRRSATASPPPVDRSTTPVGSTG